MLICLAVKGAEVTKT